MPSARNPRHRWEWTPALGWSLREHSKGYLCLKLLIFSEKTGLILHSLFNFAVFV
jgi:hypothetical protein